MRELLKNGPSFLLRRQTNILSAAFVIMVTYALSHLIGLLKTRLLISVFFGSKAPILDVYYAAFVIPDTIFQLLVIGSLSAAFIPIFTRYLSKKASEAWYVAAMSLNLVLMVFLVISIMIFIFAPQFSQLIAPGFNPTQIATMSSLLRVMLMAQLFFCVSGFLTGMIQSHQQFLIPALAPVAYNLGIIGGIYFLSPTLGIYGPAWGVVIGAAIHMLIQLPSAVKLGFRFIPRLDFSHPGVKEIITLIPPRSLALGIDQIEQFVSVILASLLAPGSLTILNVARLLYALPTSLFGVTIGQAALPTLSLQYSQADKRHFLKTLTDSFLQVAFFALPLSTIFIILRIPIVRLVFGASSFPWTATLLTGKTLAILAISSSASAIMQLIVRGFYSLHDTRTPLAVGLFSALINTIFSVLAVQIFHLGVAGLAISISVTTIIEAVSLFLILNTRLQTPIELKNQVVVSLAKMIMISLITGISLWVPMHFLDQFVFDTTRTLPLIALTGVASFIGLFTYLFLCFLFRIDQLAEAVSLAKKVTHLHQLFASAETLSEPVILPAPDQN
jgi:putative peptidoglycan lipid II flippase